MDMKSMVETLSKFTIDEARIAICKQIKVIVEEPEMKAGMTSQIKDGVADIVRDALAAAKAEAAAAAETEAAKKVDADEKEGDGAQAAAEKINGGNSIQPMSGGLASAPFTGGRRRRTRRASSRRTRRRHSSKCRKCHRRRSRRRVMKGGNDGGACSACGESQGGAFD
jgi:hypothetical protein